MQADQPVKKTPGGIQWYESEIALRGYEFDLPGIKAAYRELLTLTKEEGDKLIAGEPKPEKFSESDLQARNKNWRDNAFRVTVSVTGFNGITKHGDTDEIFDADDLPQPIKEIYFTNITAFKPFANGQPPYNHFSVSIQFDKPPLFDPNQLVSHPTQNYSSVKISAKDIGYYRAVESITDRKLKLNKQWYSWLHEKFAYDLGFWFGALPCALYWVTVGLDHWLPISEPRGSFKVAAYIYGLGLSMLIYRALFSYLKWAFPVNVLDENQDRAQRHRITLGAILTFIIAASAKSLWSHLVGK